MTATCAGRFLGPILLLLAMAAGPAHGGMPERLERWLAEERFQDVVDAGSEYLASPRHAGDDEVLLLVQQAAFRLATAEDTIKAYRSFLARYTGSPYDERIREQLSLVVFREEVIPADSISTYRKFRAAFPGSSAVTESFFREEEVAWRKARAADDVATWKAFQADYAGGRYAPFAAEREAELTFRAVRAADSLDLYLTFLRQHPDSKYAPEARARSGDLAWNRAVHQDTVEAWRDFRTAFTEGERSERAYARELALAWDQTMAAHAVDSYRGFQHLYPETDMALAAEELEWDLYHYQRDAYPGELGYSISRAHRLADGSYQLYVDVVDASGQLVGGLREQHFSVYDAGFGAEIVDFAGMEQDRPLDVVFVVDISGSMRDEIDGVKEGIIRFADIMRLRSRDFRLGLVTFIEEVFAVNGRPPVQGGLLTDDPRTFQQWVASIELESGSEEDHYLALDAAARIPYRENAQRLLIVLSDEDPTKRGRHRDGVGLTRTLASQALATYCVAPPSAPFRALAEATGGALFPLQPGSDFAGIMEAISQKASKQYRLVYRRPPLAPPVMDDLKVRLRVRSDHAWLDSGIALASPGMATPGVSLFRAAWGEHPRLYLGVGSGTLFCSDDGTRWTPCGEGLPLHGLADLLLDHRDPALVWGRDKDGMAWFSADRGDTFTSVPLEAGAIVAMGLAPSETPGAVFACDGHRVWTHLPGGSWELVSLWSSRADLTGLASEPRRQVLLLPGEDGVLWRSADAGRTFEAVASPPWGATPPARFFFHPHRAGLAFAAGAGGLYRSLDDGRSWRVVDLSGFATDGKALEIRSLEFDTTVRQLTLAVTDRGVLASDDLGRTWYDQSAGIDPATGSAVGFATISPSGRVLLASSHAGTLYGMEQVADREFAFSDVFFASGSAEPHRSLWPHLEDLGRYLRRNPSLRLRVEGHTDSDGSDTANQELSDRRARWVCDFLQRQGVPANRLIAAGYGESHPLFPNSTTAGKARNRRVELVVLAPQRDLPPMEGME